MCVRALTPCVRALTCVRAFATRVRLACSVPLVGWDVAITREHGTCLLEANLSCNFFRATFDVDAYSAFVEEVLAYLEA